MREWLQANHVVGLATAHEGALWAASCFYVFDPEAVALIVMTDRKTRHGQLMLASPRVAGTVAGQPDDIRDIRGVQFAGRAMLLEPGQTLVSNPEHGLGHAPIPYAAAQARYVAAHPVARALRADLWCIWLDEIKHTENRVAFAQKMQWRRAGAPSEGDGCP